MDSNLITVLPDFVSPKLELFTAPANKLVALPRFEGRLDRLDVHGNALTTVIPAGSRAQWDKIRNLKLMGNMICELPEELGLMSGLRTLLVSGNRLTALPASVASLRCLEWLFAYNNAIVDLPVGLLRGSSWLDRVLLEGNPLSASAMDMLISDAPLSKIKALALDTAQVRTHSANIENWRHLPSSITVGNLVHTEGCAQYYMKLVRASQLRRREGLLAVGEPGGPADSGETPAALLVVAFAASQGEPEWLGVLRRLGAVGRVAKLPPPVGHIAEEVGGLAEPPTRDPKARMAALWSQCRTGVNGMPVSSSKEPAGDVGANVKVLADFDVLSVIDHRMQWYTEDEAAFSRALAAVAKQHQRSLFIGASMGGFGALLHGGKLADGVVAFGPQARLDQATLRPPAANPKALEALSARVRNSVFRARARGAQVDVHCAADEHCWHALSLPLADLCLTVHPLLPRKPFARLLDRAEMLEPIVADAIYRVLQAPAAAPAIEVELESAIGDMVNGSADSESRIIVTRWAVGGRFSRHWACRGELLRLCFGPGVPYMPRPGDWFCPRCRCLNTSSQFFCSSCGVVEGAGIVDDGVTKIPGGRDYPRSGDWGCGKCGAALCGYNDCCTVCWGTKEHGRAVVVA